MVILVVIIAFICTQQKKKLKKHETICKDHDFCYIKMPDEDNKFLKYIPGEKSLKFHLLFMLT